jgi:hypothetical protein
MRKAAAVAMALATVLVLAASASADPTHAKNAFTFLATCDNGLSAPVVINNANGQGSGTNNHPFQAQWAPAHVVGSNLVFHPASFDLSFSFFDVASGETFTDSEVATRSYGKIATSCDISGSQTDPAGNVFSISGTVGGWFS